MVFVRRRLFLHLLVTPPILHALTQLHPALFSTFRERHTLLQRLRPWSRQRRPPRRYVLELRTGVLDMGEAGARGGRDVADSGVYERTADWQLVVCQYD